MDQNTATEINTCPQCRNSNCTGGGLIYCPNTTLYHDATDDVLARQAAQTTAIMLDDPTPPLAKADRDVVEAVRGNAETHEFVMISRKSAMRLIRLIDDAYPA